MSTITAPATRRLPRGEILANAILIAGAVVLLVVGGLLQPAFLSPENIIAVLRSASLVGIAAIGMTFITLSGNLVSLSTEQTAILAAISFAALLSAGVPLVFALLATLGVAAIIGLLQGVVVALGLNAIVTTLGAGAAIIGIASLVTDNRTINVRSDAADWLGTSRIAGIPIQVLIFLGLVIVTAILVSKTTFGRSLMLVGENEDAARSSRLGVRRVTVISFVIAAVFAGICGILLVSQVGQAKTTNFSNFNIDVIAAVLVGGTAVQGGFGSTVRTAIGAVFIALLTNYMLLSQLPVGIRLVVQGAVVVIAVVGFHLLRKRFA